MTHQLIISQFHASESYKRCELEVRQLFMNLLTNDALQSKMPSLLLKAALIHTPLGLMVALSSEKTLYLLEFVTRKKLMQEVQRLQQRGFSIQLGETKPLLSIRMELEQYFSGTLTVFKTPYQLLGTPFQQRVWRALNQIPYGRTRSYAEQALMLEKPTAFRAVANANGANQLAIIIPCHRVIASNGTLGGYGGGLPIKQWLLEHESKVSGF